VIADTTPSGSVVVVSRPAESYPKVVTLPSASTEVATDLSRVSRTVLVC
jgi:hypothetical protein